jgi:hypothetical protein
MKLYNIPEFMNERIGVNCVGIVDVAKNDKSTSPEETVSPIQNRQTTLPADNDRMHSSKMKKYVLPLKKTPKFLC